MSRFSTIKMTAKQFMMLGEDPPGVRLELAHGEIVVSPSPSPGHGYTLLKLATILGTHVETRELGIVLSDIDTPFDDFNVRRPDIFFFSNKRQHLVGKDRIAGTPDLAIEILSPGSEKMDRRDKFDLYAAGKIKYYWIVDPRQHTIEAYRLSAAKYVGRVRGSGSDVVQLPPFKNLKLDLAKLWWPK